MEVDLVYAGSACVDKSVESSKNEGMQVFSVPLRLRWVCALLLLTLVGLELEVLLLHPGVSFALLVPHLSYWLMVGVCILIPLCLWIQTAKSWAIYFVAGLFLLWTMINFGLTIRIESPILGFFSLALLVYLGVVFILIKMEMNRSFFSSPVFWYEGSPQGIPGIFAQLCFHDSLDSKTLGGEVSSRLESSRWRVACLDEDGAMVFKKFKNPAEQEAFRHQVILHQGGPLWLELTTPRGVFRCPGMVRTLVRGGSGFGFQFIGLSGDQAIDVGLCVQELRGNGYVE
jgi:hypothetical protein